MPDPTEDTILRRLIRDLERLDPRTRRRIVDYLADRYTPPTMLPTVTLTQPPDPELTRKLRDEIDKMTAAQQRRAHA